MCIRDWFRRAAGERPAREAEDQVAALEELAGTLRGPAWVLGGGADEFLRGLENAGGDRAADFRRGPAEWDRPRASILAALSREALAVSSFDQEAIHSLKPSYLRPSEPELVLARKLAGKDQ